MSKRVFLRSSVQMLVLSVFTFSGLLSVFPAKTLAQSQNNAARSTSALHWEKCADAIEGYPNSELSCADLRVPLDYSRPNGRKITIKVSRVAAANPQLKRGVLLMNPGGPGGPGVDLPQLFSLLMPPEVVAQYDLIGFDPRGVGQSTPVTCGLSGEDSAAAMVPQARPGGFVATSTFMEKVAKKCASTSGSIMPYMTTNNTARDMDQIRQALGVAKISYLGYSYGTYLGAVYASRYPNRTDRFVLDSATSPEWTWREQFRSWRMAERERFPDFAQYLIDNESEFHLGSTGAEVNATFTKLFTKLNAHPLVFDDGSQFGGEQFRLLTFGALYSDGSFPEAGAIWQYLDELPVTVSKKEVKQRVESLMGRGTAIEDTPIDNNAASALAVLCDDVSWSHTPAQYQSELMADTVIAPKFGPVGSNIWPCAFWTSQPKEALTPITSNGPRNILMVQNTRDPATPYVGAQDMRNKLGKRAQFVTVDQGGHAAAFIAENQCATDSVSNYLTQGKLAKVDTICEAQGTSNSAATSLRSSNLANPAKQKAVETLRRRIR